MNTKKQPPADGCSLDDKAKALAFGRRGSICGAADEHRRCDGVVCDDKAFRGNYLFQIVAESEHHDECFDTGGVKTVQIQFGQVLTARKHIAFLNLFQTTALIEGEMRAVCMIQNRIPPVSGCSCTVLNSGRYPKDISAIRIPPKKGEKPIGSATVSAD
jgi:hypothetical protein